MTKIELFKLERRLDEINQILDQYVYIDDDVLNNLNSELDEIIYKLTESIKNKESEKLVSFCQIVKH